MDPTLPLSLTLLLVLLGAFAALALWATWVMGVLWYYRIRSERPKRLRARCSDGWEIAVYHRPAPGRRFREPVLLCHGFAANHHTFDFDPPHSLAHVLAEAGFECFTVEWRGTGRSGRPPRGYPAHDHCADDYARKDAPALIDLALRETGASRAFWLGHSMGGLIGYAVAQGPHGDKLAGLLALGSPVYFQYDTTLRGALRLGRLAAWPFGLRQRLLSATVAPFLGYVVLPLADVVANPQAIPPPLQRKVFAHLISSVSRKLVLQFEDWATHDAFRSFDRTQDWRAGIARLSLPMLIMGGSADRLAPPACVRAQFELSGSADKTLMVFGRDNGDELDYGHGDLLFGAGAPVEVYPRIRRWLEEHATPLEQPEAVPGERRESGAAQAHLP